MSINKLIFVTATLVVQTIVVNAATNTWSGLGNWNSSSNWSLSHVPIDTEDVVISGNVLLTNPTASLSSYTLNSGRIQTNDGWGTIISAQVVTIIGTLTHAQNSALSTNEFGEWVPNARIYIVCSNLTINTTGVFNVVGKGYLGGMYGSNGFGPGGGVASPAASDRGGGGGHGAEGSSWGLSIGGKRYDSASMPIQPGSGGGSETRYPLQKYGGHGGGLVWVDASGLVLLNGTINANGGEGAGNSGAGSGGGVYIHCGTFTGNGSITANGGSWYVGGGGGRISVVYTNLIEQILLTPAVKFDAASTISAGTRSFDNGSLYFPDTIFFPYPTIFGSYNIDIPTMVPTWTGNSLTITNGEVHFPVGCSVNISSNLTIGNRGVIVFTNNSLLCGGNFTFTNGGKASFYAEATNGVSPAYGALVVVTGVMNIASGSTNYVYSHPYNGGSVYFDVGELLIASNGTINANGTGFAGGGLRGTNGWGPGGGKGYFTSNRGGGGGYGGRGATHAAEINAKGGTNYGNAYAPLYCGSGGGDSGGGRGGGLVWMRVRGVSVVNGSILANGGVLSFIGGDGSGGGIFLDCGKFSGKGSLFANGGQPPLGGASGGGGRIAVWCGLNDVDRSQVLDGIVTNVVVVTNYVKFTGTTSVTNALVGYPGELAQPGTVYFVLQNKSRIRRVQYFTPIK